MIRIFFKNLFRSILTSIIVAIVTIIVTIIITAAAELIGEMIATLQNKPDTFEITPLANVIIDSIVAAVASFLWFSIGMVTGEWFFSGVNDCVKRPPHAFFGVLMLLIIPVLIGGASAYMMYTGYGKLISAMEAATQRDEFLNIYLLLFELFPAVTVSQVMYFFAMLIHYKGCQICKKCGRMFCISYGYTGHSTYKETKYKTKTSKETVGSISAGGTKIADVTANVTRGHYETTTTSTDHYKGRCIRCGDDSYSNSTTTYSMS